MRGLMGVTFIERYFVRGNVNGKRNGVSMARLKGDMGTGVRVLATLKVEILGGRGT